MATLSELCDLSEKQLFSQFFHTFIAISIMDLEKNKIIELVSATQNQDDNEYIVRDLQTHFDQTINQFIDEDFKFLVSDFISPQNIKKQFRASKEFKTIEFKTVIQKWYTMELQAIRYINDEPQLVLMTLKDITDIRTQTKQIMANKRKADLIADNYVRLFLDANEDVYSEIFKFDLTTGNSKLINIKNQKINETDIKNLQATYMYLLDRVHESDKDLFMEKTNLSALKELESGTKINLTYRSKVKDSNEYHWYTLKITINTEDSDALYQTSNKVTTTALEMIKSGHKIATFFIGDINDEMNEKNKLLAQSEHDKLTGLFNRNKLDKMIHTEYAELDSCGVLFLDVNNLKTTNDKLGHEAGDNLLNVAADSIRSLQNRKIHAYRLGGDEFIVVMSNCSEEEIAGTFRTWNERLANLVEETNIPCTVAVGSAWTDNNVNVEELIQLADDRMYANKKKMKEAAGISPDSR